MASSLKSSRWDYKDWPGEGKEGKAGVEGCVIKKTMQKKNKGFPFSYIFSQVIPSDKFDKNLKGPHSPFPPELSIPGHLSE